jgi:hypothetical protein
VIALSHKLIAEHGGQVPGTREALQELPGVGRKTANVVLNMAFGQPTMAVDTHIFRIGNRTGLAPGKDPLAVELKLLEVIPGKIHDARAPLVDPARPLRLSGASSAVREMRDRRYLQVAGQDRRGLDPLRLVEFDAPLRQPLVHVHHHRHREQRRGEVDDRDRDEHRD